MAPWGATYVLESPTCLIKPSFNRVADGPRGRAQPHPRGEYPAWD